MENNDFDIINNNLKTHEIKSTDYESNASTANLDEYIQEDDTKNKSKENDEDENYKLFMNICNVLYDSMIKNKKSTEKKDQEKSIQKNNIVKEEYIYSENINPYDMNKNNFAGKIICENTERNIINQQNDYNFNKMGNFKDVTKSFLPSEAQIPNWPYLNYSEKIMMNQFEEPKMNNKYTNNNNSFNYLPNSFQEINFCADGGNLQSCYQKKFTSSNNNQFFSNENPMRVE